MLKGGWAMPDASALTDLGIHVCSLYEDEPRDVTNRASFGIGVCEMERRRKGRHDHRRMVDWKIRLG